MIADGGDVVDEQNALHEVELGKGVLVQVVVSKIIHRHHKAAELNLRPLVFLGPMPFLVLEQVVADVPTFTLLDLDGDAGVGVVEVDTVIKAQMRPELAVRVVAASSVPFVLIPL